MDNLKMYARKHEVTIACIGVSTCVTGSREMIGELIDNLCNNAIRYNNQNGNVLVEVGAREGHAFLRVKIRGSAYRRNIRKECLSVSTGWIRVVPNRREAPDWGLPS